MTSSLYNKLEFRLEGLISLTLSFQDALTLCYGWLLLCTPVHCACETSFSIEHILSRPKGGLPSIQHNEMRDLTATLLTGVCSQVATEPELQPVPRKNFL